MKDSSMHLYERKKMVTATVYMPDGSQKKIMWRVTGKTRREVLAKLLDNYEPENLVHWLLLQLKAGRNGGIVFSGGI